jgi:hypothetical protein
MFKKIISIQTTGVATNKKPKSWPKKLYKTYRNNHKRIYHIGVKKNVKPCWQNTSKYLTKQ